MQNVVAVVAGAVLTILLAALARQWYIALGISIAASVVLIRLAAKAYFRE